MRPPKVAYAAAPSSAACSVGYLGRRRIALACAGIADEWHRYSGRSIEATCLYFPCYLQQANDAQLAGFGPLSSSMIFFTDHPLAGAVAELFGKATCPCGNAAIGLIADAVAGSIG